MRLQWAQAGRVWILLGLTVLANGGLAYREASAGYITATLTANPSTLSEGGYSNLTLSLHDSPSGSSGYMTYLSGTINGGNGDIHAINQSLSGTDYSTTVPITYGLPGTFTAAADGTVSMQDYDAYTNYYWSYNPFTGWYLTSYTYYQWDASAQAIHATTQLHVNNVSPTITQINWTPTVLVGADFSFSAAASDPGLPAGEQLTFAYDLNGQNTYTDLIRSGITTDAETYHFNDVGVHAIGIKVTDSYGGVTFGSFDVNVVAPEPSSLALFGLGAAGMAVSIRRRQGRVS